MLSQLLSDELSKIKVIEAERARAQDDLLSTLLDQRAKMTELNEKLKQREEAVAKRELELKALMEQVEQEKQYQNQLQPATSILLDVGGRTFRTTTSTLMKGGQDGATFFHGLLRHLAATTPAPSPSPDHRSPSHGYTTPGPGHYSTSSAAMAGSKPIEIDANPTAFEYILDYLRHYDDPASQECIEALLPRNERERSLVRLLSHRWGLTRLESLLTPREDIVAFYAQEDVGAKEREDELRRRFVSDRMAAVTSVVVSPGSGRSQSGIILDVFHPSVHASFKIQDPSGGQQYPLLFTQVQHHLCSLQQGEMPLVDSLQAFMDNLKYLTSEVLEDLDWSNVCLAGGAVLACLIKPPSSVTASDDDEAKRAWFGPDVKRRGRLEPAKSGFGNTDLDLFVYGLTPEQATAKLDAIVRHVGDKLANRHGHDYDDVVIVRSEHCITITGCNKVPHVQVILRIYSCAPEVIVGFDIDSCCVGYTGDRVFCNERFRRSLTQRMNLVDPDRQSRSYECRLAKYAKRGFRVAVPGFDRRAVDSGFYLRRVWELDGLAKLLKLEELSPLTRAAVNNQLPVVPEERQPRNPSGNDIIQDNLGNPAGPPGPQFEDAVDSGPVSDYASTLIPHNVEGWDLRCYLYAKSWGLQKRGMTQGFVWETLEAWVETDDPAANYVLDATRLRVLCVPGLHNVAPRLSIPLKLEWMMENPGRQGLLTGSFNPVEGDWTRTAYGRGGGNGGGSMR